MTGAKLRGKASRPGRRFAVAQLPAFIDNSRPTPESAGRKLFIHAATIATLLASSVYLGWRIVDTVNLAVWWVSVPLVAAEVHNTFGLLLFTLALWDIDVSPPWRPVDRTGLRVAVLVTTYNEPEEGLIPTIAAPVALEAGGGAGGGRTRGGCGTAATGRPSRGGRGRGAPATSAGRTTRTPRRAT